jgi:hypothetical protein
MNVCIKEEDFNFLRHSNESMRDEKEKGVGRVEKWVKINGWLIFGSTRIYNLTFLLHLLLIISLSLILVPNPSNERKSERER